MTGDITSLIGPLKRFFTRHHPVIFISVISILLAGAVYSLYDVLTSTREADTSAGTSSIGQFDQKTIDRIKTLHSSTDSAETLVFPSPRANPFTE